MKQVIPAIRPCITYTRQQTGFYMVHRTAREPADLVIPEKQTYPVNISDIRILTNSAHSDNITVYK